MLLMRYYNYSHNLHDKQTLTNYFNYNKLLFNIKKKTIDLNIYELVPFS